MVAVLTVFMLIIPCAACIGMVQFFIAINACQTDGKKIFCITLFLGLFLSAANFTIADFIAPKVYSSLAMTQAYVADQGNPLSALENNPHAMNSIKLIKTINTISAEKHFGYENILNIYKIELHKRYALSAGAFIFAFFALVIALFVQRKKIVGLVISIFSCILYWALLTFGESLSLQLGKNAIVNIWFPSILFLYFTSVTYPLYKLYKRHSSNEKTQPPS